MVHGCDWGSSTRCDLSRIDLVNIASQWVKFGKLGSGFVEILLLSGVSTAVWESSLFVRADVSLDEASLLSICFGTCGDLSGFDLRRDPGGGSGEELSTALEVCWLLGSRCPARGGPGAREAESDCDRRWAVDSL